MDYTNENDERKIVIVPEKKKKIESIKNKYNNLSMDDKTAEKIRKLEVTNKILKASAILVGVATAINAVIPDAIPLLDEAIMGGITTAISGASVIVSNKIEDLSKYGTTFEFTAGGVLNSALVSENEGILLIAAFVMILGFSVKAGMFPMHAWLPVAHPVAPAPASAVLSGIIVKAGVLGIIRVVFFLFGVDFIRGTWVQSVWIILALITVFMGSMLAYWEKDLKKRFC